MTALTEFLLQRIADDEAVAKGAIDPEPQTRTYYSGHTEVLADKGEWRLPDPADGMNECRIEGVFMIIYDEGGHTRGQAEHIARHDPARVLAECEAKRRIVEWHRCLDDWEPRGACNDCADTFPCRTLRALATIHADHPDYDESWRP